MVSGGRAFNVFFFFSSWGRAMCCEFQFLTSMCDRRLVCALFALVSAHRTSFVRELVCSDRFVCWFFFVFLHNFVLYVLRYVLCALVLDFSFAICSSV